MEQQTPKSLASDEQARRWLARWVERLGITVPVRTERVSIWRVVGPDGRPGCSLVGVVLDETHACIYHTRRLTEEDVVHELLHVRHPEWSEAAVVETTAALLSASRRRRQAA